MVVISSAQSSAMARPIRPTGRAGPQVDGQSVDLTDMLSPLIMYSPSGTISTGSSVEKTRSTAEARMMLVWRSYPLNEPCKPTDQRRERASMSCQRLVDRQSVRQAEIHRRRAGHRTQPDQTGRRGGATSWPTMTSAAQRPSTYRDQTAIVQQNQHLF